MILIRPIAAQDGPAYRAVRLQALQDAPEAFGSTWAQESLLTEADWKARATLSDAGQSARGFFAIQGDEVCGLVVCLLSQSAPHTAHVYALWTAPSVRGQGVGRALLEQCIAWATGKGVQRVLLSVTQTNSPAMRLYRSLGFCPVGDGACARPGSDFRVQDMEWNVPASR